MQDINVVHIGRWRCDKTVSPLSPLQRRCRGDLRRHCRFRADTSGARTLLYASTSQASQDKPDGGRRSSAREEADQQAAVDTAFLAMMGNGSDDEAGGDGGGDDATPPPPP
jgi:hypothetical protein